MSFACSATELVVFGIKMYRKSSAVCSYQKIYEKSHVFSRQRDLNDTFHNPKILYPPPSLFTKPLTTMLLIVAVFPKILISGDWGCNQSITYFNYNDIDTGTLRFYHFYPFKTKFQRPDPGFWIWILFMEWLHQIQIAFNPWWSVHMLKIHSQK